MDKKNLDRMMGQDLLLKYIELEKNYLLLKSQLEEKSNPSQKYKTELCKKYQISGFCPYGNKCQFAHGEGELVSKLKEINYKKEKCKSFYEKGYCPYGNRCKFQHDERKFKDVNFSYFYFRMFLLNYFGFLKNNKKFQEKTKILFNKRLKVFENIVQSNTQNANIGNKFDAEKGKYNFDLIGNNNLTINSNNYNNDKINFNNKIFLKDSIYKIGDNDYQTKKIDERLPVKMNKNVNII